jgi:site-specific recombinase XerD
VAYAYGLRRNETRMLDVADFGRNPHADEFGDYGVLYVRYGKEMKSSAPKRRSVLTVWDGVPEILAEWIDDIRPMLAIDGNPALWPSVRAPRVDLAQINARLSAYRDALGLDAGLDFHSLRRSYVTHLIEAGWDPLFVQQQVGHEHASTTVIYTCVSSDFRTRTLRQALDATMGRGTTTGPEGEMSMKRQVSYRWRLREMMATRGVFTATELMPLLHERGIDLSASQVHRLVTGTPEGCHCRSWRRCATS